MLELLYDFETKDLEDNIELKDEDTFMFDLKSTCTFKDISYVTPYGNVKGNITVSKDIVTFNPSNIEEIQEMISQNQKQQIQNKLEQKSPKKKPLIKVSDFYLNIEIFDIYSINTYVVEFDSMKNYHDIYIDLFLETANGMGKPLQDQQNNKFLLKVTFKSANHYNSIDIEELQKRLLNLAQQQEQNNQDIYEIDTQDTSSENNLLDHAYPNFKQHDYQPVTPAQQISTFRVEGIDDSIKSNSNALPNNNINNNNNNKSNNNSNDSPSSIIPSNQQQLKNDIYNLRKTLNSQLYKLNRAKNKEKKGTLVSGDFKNQKLSYHQSLSNFNVAEKRKKIKLYSTVGFTFIHFLEIKLRYLINEMGYEDNASKESGTFVFFWEKIFYKYVHQVNYSYTFDLDQQYVPERDEESFIFTKNDKYFNQIIQNLPSCFQHSDWSLSYSPNKHGYSYNEFLFRCSASLGPHVIVIKDTKDNIFGGFASHGWKKSKYFYGDGESFLFKFEHIDQLNEKKIKVFRWTGQNNSIQYCGMEGIAMGNGENYGLFINRDFYKGLSFPTFTFGNKLGLHIQNNETFDNSKKISIQGEFQIKEIEFWSLDPYLQEKMNQIKKPSLLHPKEDEQQSQQEQQ